MENYIVDINNTLNESVYGHTTAKNQILKIIAQWMNGEQSGYCFGFEGSPGIGKTSLAKHGLANCLKDDNGVKRPFSFIALGGSSNGNAIEGYGYTYVNSSWGKIVEVLMDSKCMNPIIYIDELDKVSKTENGREIIGILTHLIDSTQNDTFQDKYFSGIDLDLSKALFIFSYNDATQIDPILLDRIHRIKFDNLSLEDKIVIVRKHLLPEINKKMGFENVVEISDEIIEYIIETFTLESGVRKLKEVLFDLFGEINLNILQESSTGIYEIPIIVTKENLENKYLKKYDKIVEKKIHSKPEIGIINGLWANSLGKGGIIPIQTQFFPSSVFLDLKLTGLQGDVMKESMNVAKTLAWNLTNTASKKKWIKHFEDTKCQGLHIHCPEGSIAKDGPSAGTAITIAIYSLFNKKHIKNDIAITGEITLNGEITAIGGLEMKIIGGIKSGIKTFLFPKANCKDYHNWRNKNNNKDKYDKINFIEISKIEEVFQYVFE
jgi:ATP-dependent Lon protease